MSEPDVSVVIPTRNRLGLLAQTLHTVLTQDVDLEVIVVDEASEDETPRWLAAHTDGRVRTVRHDTPRGLSEARNSGIAAARGRWLGFVDDDDLWVPGKLADQLRAAEQDDTPWAYGGEIVFTDGPRVLRVTPSPPGPERWRRLPFANTVPGGGSNAIVSREALDQVGGFDPTVNIVADWDMWIRLLQLGRPAMVDRPVMAYRIHASNMSSNVDTMLDAIHEIERRYVHLRGGEPLDWRNVYSWLWLRALNAGDRSTARKMAWKAVRGLHAGGLHRLARASVPVAARLPVDSPDAANALSDRVRPRGIVPWPPGVEDWLTDVLRVEP